jgi:hypothetical protein
VMVPVLVIVLDSVTVLDQLVDCVPVFVSVEVLVEDLVMVPVLVEVLVMVLDLVLVRDSVTVLDQLDDCVAVFEREMVLVDVFEYDSDFVADFVTSNSAGLGARTRRCRVPTSHLAWEQRQAGTTGKDR